MSTPPLPPPTYPPTHPTTSTTPYLTLPPSEVGIDAVKSYLYIGVGVGWQRRCKTCQSLRELDNQGTVCLLFLGGRQDGYRVDHIVQGGERLLCTRGMIASHGVNMVRHLRGSYIVLPVAVSGVATSENKVTHWRCHPQPRK